MAADAEQIRVLLVEDDDGDAFLVEELLREAGGGVEVQRARLLADARKPIRDAACVLLDLGLPDSQGLDGLRWLLRERPDVAVVVLTGLADEYLGEQAVKAGAQDYLVKGDVSGKLLLRVIRYAMERRRWDEAQRQLQVARLSAEENARLERGLLPSPVLDDARLSVSTRYRAGGAAAAARRRFLRRGADPGRLGARADRRRLRARPGRGRARGLPAGRVAGAGAGRPAAGRRALRRPARAQARTAGRGHVRHRLHGVGRARPVHRGAAAGRPPAAAADHAGRDHRARPPPRPRRPGSTTGRAGPPARSSSATAGRC